jgi:hypothetical protein
VAKKKQIKTVPLDLIWRWFVAPLAQYKPASMDAARWLEALWDVKNREILRFVARDEFRLPGLFCAAPLVRIQGAGRRKIRAGDTLWIRRDALNPEWIEVETVDRHAQVFVLSSTEWNAILPNLKERKG